MNTKTKLHIRKSIDNDLVVILKDKVTLTPNKSAYIGMCILDLSKVLMFQFYYNNIKYKMVTAQDYHSLLQTV